MLKEWRSLAVLCMGFMLALASCASQQPLVTIGPERGESIIEIKADNFSFKPNNIRAYMGHDLVFRVENVSGTGHNFTVNDPEGHALRSVPLPPKKETIVEVTPEEAGVYEFYCDKPFHSAFGMKGRIEVVREP
jgi:plastocyanin